MEFNFEEKFIFGHQNFTKSCFHVRLSGSKAGSSFGSGSGSGSLIADRSGILYFPMVSESSKVYVHSVQLLDVRDMGLTIASVYHVEHNKRSYLFVSCDAKEGGGCTLITYCISNLDILNGDCEISSWQILELPFKIMDAKTVTDEHDNSVIIFCGSDKKMHLYSLDAQCIIHRKKKSNFSMSLIVDEFLMSTKEEDAYLATSLPLQLSINQDTTNHLVSDTLLAYSNGIIKWFRDITELPNDFKDSEFLQEIPLYQGNSVKISNTRTTNDESLAKSVNPNPFSVTRKSRNQSADDLSKLLEEMCDEDEEFIGSKSNDFNPSLPLVSIVEDDDDEPSSTFATKHTVISPPISPMSPIVEKNIPQVGIDSKTLLFDGIVSCSCFYQIPQNIENSIPYNIENKNKNIQWSNLKPKKIIYSSCIVIGLASGSTLLVQFDDAEKPLSILPSAFEHGAVLAMTQGYISNNVCQDIFFGFYDGTVILVKCEEPSGLINPDSKPYKISFSILWQTQFTFPVLGILYGQLLGRTLDQSDVIDSTWNKNKNKNGTEVDNEENKIDDSFLSDQLAVVTTKSFHLLSVSLSNDINATKVNDINKLVSQLSSLI